MMKEVSQQTPEDPRVCKFGSQVKQKQKVWDQDFPGGPVHRNPPANTGDTGSISGPGRFHMPWGN